MNRTPIQNPYLSSATTSNSSNCINLKGLVRTGQVIAFALIQGVLFITAILAYLTFLSGDGGPANAGPASPPAEDNLVLVIIGVVACFVGCFASFVVNRLMKGMAIRQFVSTGEEVALPIDETATMTAEISSLLTTSQTRMIIGMALVEGAAVINAVIMMLDENVIHLVMIALCLAAMAVQFPTLRKKLDLIESAARASQDRI
ncbi:hypothetical protein SH528x_005935 [Novipirellula sp. SH528]|uniref:hypothetical protein n=1 Tax=Novipirellula sp. SH528 TaxID=3454466 RepID=UPI003FA0D126